jgi:uncharacterized repeat protein (TIGR03803 family)
MKLFRAISLLALGALVFYADRAPAQVFTVLHTFTTSTNLGNPDGEEPHTDLVLSGNTLYGTTGLGGSNGFGTVFSVNTSGSNFTILHSFTGGFDGSTPDPDLVLVGNTLYGTVGRGTNLAGYGSVFSLDTNGSNFSLLYTFTTNTSGALGQPNAGLLFTGGIFYGVAYQGGVSNAGSIFSLDTNGNFTLLHLFDSATDGENPFGTLISSNGTLYGMCRNGGSNGGSNDIFGSVYSISANGSNFTVLHMFSGFPSLDGHNPDGALVLSGGTLFGTTTGGGTNNGGTVFSIGANGSNYTKLHSFNAQTDEGKFPGAGLTLRGDTLYGTTLGNGNTTSGTVFSLNTNGGDFTLLYAFSPTDSNFANTDGKQPECSLAMAGNVLYGSAGLGGLYGEGTLFSVAVVPQITNFTMSGTTLALHVANGVAGETYLVSRSANLTLPLSSWLPVTTNMIGNGGNFTITATNVVIPGAPQQFFAIYILP